MKIIRIEKVVERGRFPLSTEWRDIETTIVRAIKAVDWPPGSGSFTLFDEPGKERGKGNGVKPIKLACMGYLKTLGWSLETALDIAALSRPGRLDATLPVGKRIFAVEWETGNVSSSHRAINKMALGILQGALIGGALIVPTRAMYEYLTDRVGNYEELQPYFPLWRSLGVEEGLLVLIAIEHDAVSRHVPRIPKGTEGRALQ